MKLGILTFLHNHNFGSLLQAYALQQTLLALGHEPIHLNYRPDAVEKLHNLVLSGNSPALLIEGRAKRRVLQQQPDAADRTAAMERFVRDRLQTTVPCRNAAALQQASTDLAAVIAGSDQIWSPVWMNPVYFLHFFSGRKVAYAPSLGVSRCTNPIKRRRIAAWVKAFDAVSVREQEGADLLAGLGCKHPDVMPDPVFLLSREAWLHFSAPISRAEPYVLGYFIGHRAEYANQLQAEAAQRGTDAVLLPVTAEAYAAPFEKLSVADPSALVGAIAGAEAVVTDSFHGAAFATLLGIPCRILRRYRSDDATSKNSRIDQLLRSVHGKEDFIQPSAEVDQALDGMRTQGIDWLQSALSSSENTAGGAEVSSSH